MWRENSRNLAVKFAFILGLAVFYLNLINAESISLDYPSAVSYDEEFNIKITLKGFSEAAYSVKIEILNPVGERIAQIYDESESKFKSCYYYANNIEFSGSEAEIKMKINKEYNGPANLSVNLKNSNGKISKFGGYGLEVESSGEENKPKKGGGVENEEKIEEYVEVAETEEEKVSVSNSEFNEKLVNNSDKVIYLGSVTKATSTENTQTIKSEKNRVIYKSISEKIKEYAIYAFAIFCIFILTFEILKLKSKWTKK
jgi:hypothetical protein